MLLVKLMQQNNIPANHSHIWFSQLLGMSDHISFNVANAGYNVAKYVPLRTGKRCTPLSYTKGYGEHIRKRADR